MVCNSPREQALIRIMMFVRPKKSLATSRRVKLGVKATAIEERMLKTDPSLIAATRPNLRKGKIKNVDYHIKQIRILLIIIIKFVQDMYKISSAVAKVWYSVSLQKIFFKYL